MLERVVLQGEPSGRNDVDLDSHIIPGQEGFPADSNPPKITNYE